MTDKPTAGIGKRAAGYLKEFVAELTGDARLQDEGREEVAKGRLQREPSTASSDESASGGSDR